MIKKVTGTRFPNDVSHKPLRPPVSKNLLLPSQAPEVEEDEIGVHKQHQQQQTATQAGAGLTGHTWGSTATCRGPRPVSKIDKILNLHEQESEGY